MQGIYYSQVSMFYVYGLNQGIHNEMQRELSNYNQNIIYLDEISQPSKEIPGKYLLLCYWSEALTLYVGIL